MKVFDLVRLILGNLSRRKARVALTAIGVVIGTAAVVILVSLAIGLQRNANEQLYGIGDLTQIQAEAWLFDPDHKAENIGELGLLGSITIPAQSITLYIIQK